MVTNLIKSVSHPLFVFTLISYTPALRLVNDCKPAGGVGNVLVNVLINFLGELSYNS